MRSLTLSSFRLRTATAIPVLALAAWLTGCTSVPPPVAPVPTTPPVQAFPYTGGELRLRTQSGECVLELRGEIQAAALRQMHQALQAVDLSGCGRKTLVLHASRGVLGDAITAGAMLRNRGYATQVAAGTVCDTPCLMVFAAGVERWMPVAPQPARIAFSQIPPDADFGRQVCETQWSRGQQLTLARYLRAMLPSPTATAVYQKLEAATCRETEMYGPQQALSMGLATALR